MHGNILALDPSSTTTGWALLDRSERLLQGGVIKPHKQQCEAQYRIGQMCVDLRQLLSELGPETILIEWPSGHVGRKRHHGGGAGLSVYGAACGALWQVCEAWVRSLPSDRQSVTEVELVLESDWTRSVPKPDRVAGIAGRFKEYEPGQDSGGDLADAIGLAVWFLTEHRMRLAESVR